MSSYNRMLIHRVAAWFGMEHNVDSTVQCVIVNTIKATRLPEVSEIVFGLSMLNVTLTGDLWFVFRFRFALRVCSLIHLVMKRPAVKVF